MNRKIVGNYKAWWDTQIAKIPQVKKEVEEAICQLWQVDGNILTLKKPSKPNGYEDADMMISLEKVRGDQPEAILNGNPFARQWILSAGGKYVINLSLRSSTHPNLSVAVEIYVRL